ncbi:hypothetical protein C8R46DRAFT_114076 [Mycena filopes]|nr:hypothetical protein C8R46DRAFT_114076 [Mycena filopes]
MPVRVKESPWSLSHVSRYWRSVALSEASLWSLVTLYYDAPAPVYPFPMVETQVARAKILKIHFYGQKTPTAQLLQIETFRLLARFAPQWEELSLGLTPQLVPLLSALRDRLPILRRLFLQWQPDVPEIHRVDCFQNAPSLVGAWVRGFRSIPVLFPGHHLTHYEFHSSSWDTHADILKQTLTLVVARITIEFDDDGDDSWQDPDSREIINLTCLRHLFVSHAEILNFLRLPALEQVAINSSADEGSNILGALRSAVSRSSCVLRRLCLWELPLLTPVTEILTQFPSIVDFAVLLSTPEDSPLAETLMKRLTITADGPVIAPQLRRISFAYEEDMVIDHGIYEEMINSRWRAGGFVGSQLIVAVGSSPTAAVLHGLEKLREEGLNFVFLQGRDAADAIVAWTFEGRWG